jgi:AcrR family transcriptional regulator
MPANKRPARSTPQPATPVRRTLRKRLSPADRKSQLLDSAASLIVAQGFLPVNMERLAEIAGVSKALVYSYFATPHELFNALLDREMSGLLQGGMATAAHVADLDQAAVLCAMLYFEYVARSGPLLHILLSDRYMSGHVAPQALRLRNDLRRRLTRLASRSLPLSRKEILGAIEMIIAIPEEAGRLVFHDEIEAGVARQTCHTLVSSALRALRAPDRTIAGENIP